MDELIAVKQLPIIEERLKDLAAVIDRQVEEALSMAVTPDTVKAVKDVRAVLNKQYKALEDQRPHTKSGKSQTNAHRAAYHRIDGGVDEGFPEEHVS